MAAFRTASAPAALTSVGLPSPRFCRALAISAQATTAMATRSLTPILALLTSSSPACDEADEQEAGEELGPRAPDDEGRMRGARDHDEPACR